MGHRTDTADNVGPTITALQARVAALEAALAARPATPPGRIHEDSILEAVQDAVIVVDQDHNVQFWNRAAEAIYGWRAAEVIGKPLRALLQPGYLNGADATQAVTSIEQRGSWTGLVTHCHRDGHELLIESSVRFLQDASGAISGLVGVNRDVAARVREETARRVSDTSRALLAATRNDEAMLTEMARLAVPTLGDWCMIHLVMDNGSIQPIAIQHVDTSRRAMVAPFMESYGFSSEISFGIAQVLRTGEPLLVPELLPERLDAMILDPKLRPLVRSLGLRSAMCVALKTTEKVFGTLTLITAESGRRYGPADLQIASDLAERTASAISHHRMTREVQAAAERTDTALAMLNALLTSAAIGIAFLDRDLRYTHLNAALAKIQGQPIEAHLGRRVEDMLPGYGARLAERLRGVLANGQAISDIEFTVAPGTLVQPGTYRLNYYPVREAAAHITGIGMVVFDVTERRRLQAQLNQAQKLEGIGRLAGGIAHDFNNLMTAILGYAELAADMLPDDSPVQPDLAAISTTTQRAAALTRQLLAFARKQVLDPVPLSLNELVGEVAALLQRLIGEDIHLTTQLAPDLRAVRADPGQIEQVLINLAVNARDAMPDGGHLSIETANVTLDEDYTHSHVDVAPGPYVRIAVTDTGIGMPPDVQARMFDPFFTTKPVGKGTGLGLATSYGIIQQHGGAIWVYSEVGQGTTFAIYLPQMEAPSVSLAAPPEEMLPRGSETVLVVEDEEAVRSIAARMLRSQGYTVLEASNGQDALEYIAGDAAPAIDLVLTDMVMPGLSGDALGEQLQARLPHVKIVYMSGYTEHAMVQRGELEPTIPLLHKPFSRTTLAQAVRRALDQTADTT